jgi:hypothetical protein
VYVSTLPLLYSPFSLSLLLPSNSFRQVCGFLRTSKVALHSLSSSTFVGNEEESNSAWDADEPLEVLNSNVLVHISIFHYAL